MSFKEFDLLKLSRRELQNIAKKLGVKANQKSSLIIKDIMYTDTSDKYNRWSASDDDFEDAQAEANENDSSRANQNQVSKSFMKPPTEALRQENKVDDNMTEILRLIFDTEAGEAAYTYLLNTVKSSLADLNAILCSAVDKKLLVCVHNQTGTDDSLKAAELAFKISDEGRKFVLKHSTGVRRSDLNPKPKPRNFVEETIPVETLSFKQKVRKAMIEERKRRRQVKIQDESLDFDKGAWDLVESKSKPGSFYYCHRVTKECRWRK